MDNLSDFLIPGAFIIEVLAGFIGIQSTVPKGLNFAFSVFAAVMFWAVLTKVCWVLLKKLFGFDQPPRHQ